METIDWRQNLTFHIDWLMYFVCLRVSSYLVLFPFFVVVSSWLNIRDRPWPTTCRNVANADKLISCAVMPRCIIQKKMGWTNWLTDSDWVVSDEWWWCFRPAAAGDVWCIIWYMAIWCDDRWWCHAFYLLWISIMHACMHVLLLLDILIFFFSVRRRSVVIVI